MSRNLRQRMDELHLAAQRAAAAGHAAEVAELLERAAELEQEADRRPGDFADDGCGDPTLSLVPGWAC